MTGIVIQTDEDRRFLCQIVRDVPLGTFVEMGRPKRSLPQNAKMWAMLGEVASQVQHAGRFYTDKQWKLLFMHALGQEIEFIPSLDGSTFIPYEGASSEMKVGEMSDMIEFMYAWGTQNGVVFREPKTTDPAREAANG